MIVSSFFSTFAYASILLWKPTSCALSAATSDQTDEGWESVTGRRPEVAMVDRAGLACTSRDAAALETRRRRRKKELVSSRRCCCFQTSHGGCCRLSFFPRSQACTDSSESAPCER